MSARLRDLPPEALDAVVDDGIETVLQVLRFMWPHVFPNYPGTPRPGGWCDVWTTVKACLERREIPPVPVLLRVANWADFELTWRAEGRDLTPDERVAFAATTRLRQAATKTLTESNTP
jgi:hypothetical protein